MSRINESLKVCDCYADNSKVRFEKYKQGLYEGIPLGMIDKMAEARIILLQHAYKKRQ